MAQTLEELKAENAAREAEEAEAPQAEAEAATNDAGEEEGQESGQVAEPEQQEGQSETLEAWQLTDEQTSDQGSAENTFTGRDIAAAKHKLRAKLERQHNAELEELKAEIAQLKAQPIAAAGVVEKPKRADFLGSDDPDEAYMDALTDWKLNQAQQSQRQMTEASQAKRNLETSVDQHYERAAKLASESGIDPAVYQQSDLAVRSMLEGVRPQQGDLIMDQLINSLGEGSEKVMYYLGRNADSLTQLQAAILSDPTGMKAIAYLGRLSGQVTQPKRPASRKPAPSTRVQGDASGSVASDQFKKAYDKASKAGDMQAKMDARRAARKAGVSTAGW